MVLQDEVLLLHPLSRLHCSAVKGNTVTVTGNRAKEEKHTGQQHHSWCVAQHLQEGNIVTGLQSR